MEYRDFIIDCESLGSKPNAICLDISIVIFNPDTTIQQSFDELVASGKRFKLNVAEQKGRRSFTKATVDWWKNKDPEAQKQLLPTPEDLTIKEAIPLVLQYLKDNKVDFKRSQMWCRGNSFDIPLFCDMMREALNIDHTADFEPVQFWNQRDIRTAIEAYSMIRGTIKCPLRKGVLDGFVAHDSIHDCAKDVIMLKTAMRYSYGLEECPGEDDIDPDTIPFKRF